MPEEFFEPLRSHTTPPVYRYFDGAAWKESASGKTLDILSPVDGSVVGSVQHVLRNEIDDVFTRAKSAQKSWEKTPLNKRIHIMHLAADWMRHFDEYLTAILMKEIGKTHDDAHSEIVRTADLIDYFADEAQSIHGESLDSDNFPGFDKGRIALIERVAHGVVLAIAPFNYPVNLSASKIAPALLMGNSVVFKPPTQGGISGLHLVQAFYKAGLPDGVLSAVTGSGNSIGDYLVSHNAVDMVTFTGSSETGMNIAGKAPMKPLLFECGGNNPTVVFPDADMTLTAREIIKGAFSYSGQRCTAIKYVLGTTSILETLEKEMLRQLPELVHMGDPRNPETKLVGPIISESVAGQIEAMISQAVSQGARIAVGGKRNGAYLEPTILTNVGPSMDVVTHELFGPVISFISVENLSQAVNIINSSTFGLQASVFTKDEGAGLVFAKELLVGSVQINGSPQRGPDHFPFLGIKTSGIGVQGVRYSLESMSRIRPIVINKPQ